MYFIRFKHLSKRPSPLIPKTSITDVKSIIWETQPISYHNIGLISLTMPKKMEVDDTDYSIVFKEYEGDGMMSVDDGDGINEQPNLFIAQNGKATCAFCGNIGVKDSFYGKNKQHCSVNCLKSSPKANGNQTKAPQFKSNPRPPRPPLASAAVLHATAGLSNSSNNNNKQQSTAIVNNSNPASHRQQLKGMNMKSPQTPTILSEKSSKKSSPVKLSSPLISSISTAWKASAPKHLQNSYDWINILAYNEDIEAVPVSSFKYAPFFEVWEALVSLGLKVEVRNTDRLSTPNSKLPQEVYWIASVVKIAGYFVLLRYEGFGNDDSKDFWLNIFTTQAHPVGWCASQSKVMIPPKSVEEKHGDWKSFLIKRLTGSSTIPENFHEQLKDCLQSRFTAGKVLELVDKKRISAVRVARVDKIVGGRLHITYDGAEEEDNGFWCHQFSPLIHPVGWAQLVGHELRSTTEYARMSLQKAMERKFDVDDADFTMFPPVRVQTTVSYDFHEGMKLEAIDPLNLSTICVATVMKVLRNNYLMIGIDGMMAPDGSDWFCYHATSPCIFPVGFCKINNIELTPPQNYENQFDWQAYLQETKSQAAPVQLFKKDIPNHGFKEGMLLEAVDLMEPRLVCVATVSRVVNRLLKIHFNGWDDSYDQWCDCESAELFPAGWCQLVGHPLEPPKDDDSPNSSSISIAPLLNENSRRKKNYKGGVRRKKKRNANSSGTINDETIEDVRSVTPDMPCLVPHTAELVSPAISPPRSPPKQSITDLSNSSVVIKPSPHQSVNIQNGRASGRVRDWNMDDICRVLKENECSAYCEAFRKQVII